MANQFKLKIKLGNDAMQTPEDVAAALRKVASRLEGQTLEGRIRDINGNTVGAFEYDD